MNATNTKKTIKLTDLETVRAENVKGGQQATGTAGGGNVSVGKKIWSLFIGVDASFL